MVFELMTPSGIVLRRDAVLHGYTDDYLTRMVRAGHLHRMRQGAYVDGKVWTRAGARAQHVLLTEAVMAQYDDQVVLSHDSAVLDHGGPDHRLALDDVHVTELRGGGRRSARVVHHDGACGLLDLTRIGGHWVTSPARTVLDITRAHGVEVGVVVADDFIWRGLMTLEELDQLYQSVRHWPGSLALQMVVRLATGRSESVGETLGMLLFRRLGLPKPEQQFEIRDASGRLVATTDWAWPDHGAFGEFDGKGKYHRSRRPGESIEQCVMREKRREDEAREASGFRAVRLEWVDLFRPRETDARVRRVLRIG